MKGTCLKCGCTDDRACVVADGTCAWIDVQEDLCSVCARRLFAEPIEPASLAEAGLLIRALAAALFETGRRVQSLESLLSRALAELEESEGPNQIWTP